MQAPIQLHFRNAIYQGQLDLQNKPKGIGLAYLTNSHEFIYGSQWQNGVIGGSCAFYHENCSLMYGQWYHGRPQGLNVFHFEEMMVMTQYNKGCIQCGTHILLVFQKYSLAIILSIVEDEHYQNMTQFQLVQKKDVFSHDDIHQLMRLCQWNITNFQPYYSFIRYISTGLSGFKNYDTKKPKIRLINQSCYKFGYDQGLAILFDDQYRILSVGMHKKTNLNSLGVKYKNYQSNNMLVQQGDFDDKSQVYSFCQTVRPGLKIGKLYNNKHLQSMDFHNKFLNDPSIPYFQYFNNLLNGKFVNQLLAGYLTYRRNEQIEIKRNDKQIQEEPTDNNNNNNKLFLQGCIKNDNLLSQRQRLQKIKEQIYDSVRKKQIYHQHTLNFNKQQIIPKEIEINKQQQEQQKLNFTNKKIIHMTQIGIQHHQKSITEEQQILNTIKNEQQNEIPISIQSNFLQRPNEKKIYSSYSQKIIHEKKKNSIFQRSSKLKKNQEDVIQKNRSISKKRIFEELTPKLQQKNVEKYSNIDKSIIKSQIQYDEKKQEEEEKKYELKTPSKQTYNYYKIQQTDTHMRCEQKVNELKTSEIDRVLTQKQPQTQIKSYHCHSNEVYLRKQYQPIIKNKNINGKPNNNSYLAKYQKYQNKLSKSNSKSPQNISKQSLKKYSNKKKSQFKYSPKKILNKKQINKFKDQTYKKKYDYMYF